MKTILNADPSDTPDTTGLHILATTHDVNESRCIHWVFHAGKTIYVWPRTTGGDSKWTYTTNTPELFL